VRRIAGAVVVTAAVVAAVVAGCSGGDAKRAAPDSAPTTAPVGTARTREWIEAAADSVFESGAGITRDQANCLGRALVEHVTVARLEAAGVTLDALRESDEALPPGFAASVPEDARYALGGAFQDCGFGRFIGPLIARELASEFGASTQAKSEECVASRFDDPARRLLVSELVLNAEPSPSATSGLVDILVDCLDWAAVFGSQVPFTLSAAETECINRTARADAGFRAAIGALLGGTGDGSEQAASQLLGARIVRCLTPEHIVQLGSADG
jgi:hypothetical protein